MNRERVSVNIEVAPDTRRRLKIRAAEQGVSMGELLRPLINRVLNDADRSAPGPAPRSP